MIATRRVFSFPLVVRRLHTGTKPAASQVFTLSRAPVVAPRVAAVRRVPPCVAVVRRWMCTTPKPASEAGAEAASSGGSGQATVPMVVKVGRGARTTVRIVAVTCFTAFAGAAGYYIIRELFPSSMSPNSIFNRASDQLRANPDICSKFGDDVKFYGQDHGGRREGRRFHVPDFKYEKDGVSYTRIRFTVEGNRLKGLAYAEVASDNPEFNYLMVQVFPTREVITIVDRRAPEKPRNIRQSDVALALQGMRARFYSGGPTQPATRQQEAELGDHWTYVKVTRCDRYPDECSRDGVLDTPAWKVGSKTVKGVQTLEQLEELVKKYK